MGSEKRKLKFGCHDFLNSKPLIIPFFREDLGRFFDIVFDTPAKISEKLIDGKLDIAFIPSIDFLKDSSLKLVPDISISSDGEVKSVILLLKKEIKNVKTIVLDKKSKTSVVLLKILFKKFYKKNVKFLDDTKANLKIADARLIIGDEALMHTYPFPKKIDGKESFHYVVDLGKEWKRFTELPFVFAVIAARESVDLDFAMEKLLKSKSIGTKDMADIAMKASDSTDFPFKYCYDYLSKRIKYDLGKEELKGLSKFQDLAFEIGELKRKRKI
ncbi:MAG: hypothetical protein A3C43_09140 [Candidatus Schekmanbacteria bacterium RIFCSPHIGHO2_02_FULL_38_11]|uniref:Chorismate dehydratase n=1 Tax=Candidatus Schekmanbacteria bacterium RIFCSPLOWO2_12_FULL_38_15 TaxID=1817883 RepID=A0A1F7SKM7_9BACT|nr:MAG: hypothetical protein A2043_02155 [Candidatus Schekmanbacteria bacterium GWA2_38_9]OGL48681.1 MAG: hypothetical protein A3H37_04375 [Candidatus Schekmanbacteria bacterium RIFCSPLOWO2_02_FULL_38_14]OGL49184.1 MAG: hypothetical protein A3C43_09140 [Candidatus Schekmanbacteria bacterium RIFCSPHIGHO2_02_FULL_38_11]OGL54336.1 MAG: hypothetical protein A3G31_12060 [Candidatus Schekmanbacteria bacterium RIFCSPLOWO2_12_FULL_38_15]